MQMKVHRHLGVYGIFLETGLFEWISVIYDNWQVVE